MHHDINLECARVVLEDTSASICPYAHIVRASVQFCAKLQIVIICSVYTEPLKSEVAQLTAPNTQLATQYATI